MVFKNSIPSLTQFICSGIVVASLFCGTTSFAQTLSGTTGKLLLAANDKKADAIVFTKEANIVFPEILKGNEEQSLEYIEKCSVNRRNYLISMFTKGKKLLPKAAGILKKNNLPEEFKVLLTLESAYNGNVVSKAGAVGYWQIMDEVAKEYGMKYVAQLTPAEKKKILKQKGKKADSLFKAIDQQKDDRKNFLKSSQVAARYLKDRRVNLNDNWLLIVASYNCGVGNVWHAMEKSGKANATFWDIKNLLPEETRSYVMNFIALNVIFHNYDNFLKNTLSFYPEKIIIPSYSEKNGNETSVEEMIIED